jgi:hypothetical protein
MPAAAVAAAIVMPGAAAAQAPVAVVEQIHGRPLSVELMDYVMPGQVIRLFAGESIVLGYVTSCWRESIAGGIIVVGTEQSEVRDGKIERTKVACDAGKIKLMRQQSAMRAAGTRVPPARPPGANGVREEPALTIYGLSPVVELRVGGTMVIERIDKPGERHEIQMASEQLVRSSFYDFADHDKTLAAGGIYRAHIETRQIVFKVDPAAQPGKTPLLGRLLPFQPLR